MKRTTFGKASVALAAVFALASLALLGFKASALDILNQYGWTYGPQTGPVSYAKYVDFLRDTDLNTTDWTFTVTGSTAPTVVTHAVGGTATFTNAGADNDRIEVDETAEWIKFEAGKSYRLVFKGKYDCVTASQADIGFGVGIQDTDWLGDTAIMSDGLFFEVNDGDANLDLVQAYNATATTDYTRNAALATLTDNTTFKVVMDVVMDQTTSGKGRVIVWFNGSVVLDSILTSIPYDEELCIKYGIQNGAAEAQVLTVDYIGFNADR